MNHKLITLPSFQFIGLPLRTSNEKMQDIGAHWGRFYSENILDKIPGKVDNEVLGLYTDYEGDHTKPYTLILGCRVDPSHAMTYLPSGTHGSHGINNILVSRIIPESKYAVFAAKGKMPDCIMKAWSEIWNSGIDRAFKFDFEVYSAKSQNPEDAEVDIYISVK
jgi:predicted transcriptional regulator YdeE